jgi:Na+/melibiose symporter-like transporter
MEANLDKGNLTTKQVFGYAFYNLASLFGMITFAFLNMFYPLLGMDMALFSTALLVARVIDFFVTLFVGVIMEKVPLRIGGGKYRPWLFVSQFAIYGGLVLLFSDIFGNNTGRFIVVIIGSLLVNTTMSFIMNAMFGIMPLMAGPSVTDRNKLSAWAYRLMTLGTVFTSATSAYILQFFQGMFPGNPATAYTVMTAIFGVFYFIGIGVLRSTAKPFDVITETPAGMSPPKVSLGDMVKAVATNSQLLIYLLANTITFIGLMAMMNIMIFYWQLIVDSKFPGQGFPALYTIGSTISTLASFVFALVGPSIGMKLGKKRAMWVGLFVAAVSGVLNALFGATHWGFYVAISMIGTFSAALYSGFGVNYALDCGEYGLWKTGQDNRLIIMSMTNMPMKISAIFGGMILYALAAIGYTGPTTVITPEFIRGFMFLLGGVPAICNLIAGLLMLFAYKIKDEDAARYAAENAAKMMQQAPPPQA